MLMGKVRRKRTFKAHNTSSFSLSRHSKQKDTGSITCDNEEEVAPLPAEIMECSSIVSLTSNTTSSTSTQRRVGGVNKKWSKIGKKEKQGLKKESWKRSMW